MKLDWIGKPVMIIISGRAGVGKTTMAQFMVEHLKSNNNSAAIFSFAAGVKSIARFMGWNGDKDERGRKLLQEIGVVGRRYNKDIWAKLMVDSIFSMGIIPDYIIVDDWRFQNEFKYLKKGDLFYIFKIRVEAPDREILKGTPLYNDISERSLPEGVNSLYDFVVFNNGSLEALKQRSIDILKQIDIQLQEV